ncbi:hypothetical protein [Streptomyces sp. V3I8]|uniref:hypothetical protein n=1 Tax=Streptomyces sp. V3I8 TaxID=3042279 RepID=UPI0027D8309D|nr:hypothetical protein [Streptomyces sp. V3I8]
MYEPELGPLANKLRMLRYLKLREDKKQYDIGEIAEGVSRLYAERHQSERPVLNRQYLNDMLNGRRRNPTKNVLQYLALFFKISPAYFFEGDERTPETSVLEDEVELMVVVAQLVRTMKEAGQEDAPQLAMALMRGASEMDPREARGMILMQLEVIKRAKGNSAS